MGKKFRHVAVFSDERSSYNDSLQNGRYSRYGYGTQIRTCGQPAMRHGSIVVSACPIPITLVAVGACR